MIAAKLLLAGALMMPGAQPASPSGDPVPAPAPATAPALPRDDADGRKPELAAEPSVSVSDAELDRRIAEVDERFARIASLRADFEQRKETPLLKKPMVSTGTVVMKGERAQWRTESPRRSVLALGKGEVRLFYPDEAVVEIYPTSDSGLSLGAGPLPRFAELRASFDVARVGRDVPGWEELEGQLAVELKPKAERLKEHLRWVRVLVDTAVPCVRRVEIADADGSRTVIELRNVKVDADVADSEVELSVPEGTRESRPLKDAPTKNPEPRDAGGSDR